MKKIIDKELVKFLEFLYPTAGYRIVHSVLSKIEIFSEGISQVKFRKATSEDE